MKRIDVKKKIQKILGAFLALCMIFTLVQPTTVKAAAIPSSTILDAGDLFYFLNYYGGDSTDKVATIDGYTVTLQADITLSKNMMVLPNGKNIVLDLKGHKLTTTANLGTTTSTSSGGSFTITDSQKGGAASLILSGKTSVVIGGYDTLKLEHLYITAEADRIATQMISVQYGTLSMNDCYVRNICPAYVALVIAKDATVNIKNSELESTTASGKPVILLENDEAGNAPTVTIDHSKVHSKIGSAIDNASDGTLKIVNQSEIYSEQKTKMMLSMALTNGTTIIDNSTVGTMTGSGVAIIATGANVSLYLKNKAKLYGHAIGVWVTHAKLLYVDGAIIKSGNEETEGVGLAYGKDTVEKVTIKNANITGTKAGVACLDNSESETVSSIAKASYMDTNYMTQSALNYTTESLEMWSGKAYVSGPTFVSYAKPKTTKLSKASITYTGKEQKPTLSVLDADGKTLNNKTDYTVSIPSGRTNVGAYKYKVTYKGKYAGVAASYVTLTIVPKGTAISKLTATSGGFKASWSKQATQTTGYQIQYSTSSSFASPKTVTVSKNSTVSTSVSKLTKGKKYYVRIRTFKTVGSTKYYSTWSAAKTVTTKK